MSQTLDELEVVALALPRADRVHLVERLVASLDFDPAAEDAWAAEVERRAAQVESGEVAWLPGLEALAELKAEFR